MSRYLVDQIDRDPRIQLHPYTQLIGVAGSGFLDSVSVEQRDSGLHKLDAGGVFVFIGAQASTAWLGDYVQTDSAGFVLTGHRTGMAVPFLGTTRSGVFAGGDVRAGSTKRVATAVGAGSQAVALVHQHLAGHLRDAVVEPDAAVAAVQPARH